jgi:hypothetical protein
MVSGDLEELLRVTFYLPQEVVGIKFAVDVIAKPQE